jgi:hypothetical protein
MGLLDDAIREHLDLKRRRGADPSEVERAEREALGPVRRPQASDEADLESLPEGDEAFADEEEPFADGLPPSPGAGSELPPESEGNWTYEDEPPLAGPSDAAPAEQHTALHTPDFGDEEPPAGAAPAVEPEPAVEPDPAPAMEPDPAPAVDPDPAPRRSSPRPHPAAGETSEYDVESELSPAPATEGEDVLEETPEFLQDTPDHDRLWFEQRPPKDFDFDG